LMTESAEQALLPREDLENFLVVLLLDCMSVAHVVRSTRDRVKTRVLRDY